MFKRTKGRPHVAVAVAALLLLDAVSVAALVACVAVVGPHLPLIDDALVACVAAVAFAAFCAVVAVRSQQFACYTVLLVILHPTKHCQGHKYEAYLQGSKPNSSLLNERVNRIIEIGKRYLNKIRAC